MAAVTCAFCPLVEDTSVHAPLTSTWLLMASLACPTVQLVRSGSSHSLIQSHVTKCEQKFIHNLPVWFVQCALLCPAVPLRHR